MTLWFVKCSLQFISLLKDTPIVRNWKNNKRTQNGWWSPSEKSRLFPRKSLNIPSCKFESRAPNERDTHYRLKPRQECYCSTYGLAFFSLLLCLNELILALLLFWFVLEFFPASCQEPNGRGSFSGPPGVQASLSFLKHTNKNLLCHKLCPVLTSGLLKDHLKHLSPNPQILQKPISFLFGDVIRTWLG